MPKAKIGIIVDNLIASKQINDFIKLSKTSENYEVTHLIIQNSNIFTGNIFLKSLQYINRRGLNTFISNASFKILCKIESFIIKSIEDYTHFYDVFDLSDFNLKIVHVEPIISNSGLVYRYKKNDLEKIKSLELNLLVRGGGNILRGDILNICENGIISFHHADNDINRGGPPGFWETKNRAKRTGFIIQRLTNELDGGDVLFKGFVSTSWMYSLTLAKLYEASNPFLHHTIDSIISGSTKINILKKKPYSNSLYRTPNIKNQFVYFVNMMSQFLTKVTRKLSRKSLRWGVAYQFVDDWRDVTLRRSIKIPNPPNRFLADPFLIKKGESHFCFVEDYSYETEKGHISVYEITKDKCIEIGPALEEDFHLSYPFIFEHEGNLFMCPETHEIDEIRLYKCIKFPNEWKFEKTLMKNISAVDTNIFYKDNKWWMLTNLSTSGIGYHDSELHIFSNDNLLSEEWLSHPSNPVIFDSLCGRNGGLILENGKYFRVYQKQGFNSLGDSFGVTFGVAEIKKIDNECYEENYEFEVLPQFFKKIVGTHTYNYSEGLMVIDFVKPSWYKVKD